MKRTLVVLGIGAALCTASAGHAQEPLAVTPHFAFYSDFLTNVHDALLNTGVDRNFGRVELFQEGEEKECLEKIPGSLRTAWDLAVGYYAKEISPADFQAPDQFWIRVDLADVAEVTRERDLRFIGIARAFMQAAAPAYRACRWETQDRENRAWIADVARQLEQHGDAIAEGLARFYEMPLGGLPMRVDVMETVSWSGATTILLDPAGGHIQISNGDEGAVALELVYHEASHTLMGPEAPIKKALARAAEKTGVELPRDLWHAVQFYTTGDIVRRVLAENSESSENSEEYVPMMFAGEGGIFGWHHAVLRKAWTAYLNGQISLEEAAEALLRAVGEAAE